jgi:hypothetical protein
MVSIEIKPKANSFVKSLILSAGSSYIAEPFFKWIGLYDPKDWKFTYSFAIYIWIYLFAHYLSKRGNFENL